MTDAAPPSPDSEFAQQTLQLDLAALYALWRKRDAAEWGRTTLRHVTLAQRLLRGGEPLLAFDVLNEALTLWPDDARLVSLQGLALARCGATARARQLLQRLYDRGARDEETVALLARTYKDLALGEADAVRRRGYFERAEALYSEAFEAAPAERYWSGINAATMALLLGNAAQAQARALRVQAVCRRRLDDASRDAADSYWLSATVAESELIGGRFDLASDWYRSAAGLPGIGLGDIASTRGNARLILDALGADPAFVDECLPRPRVVVFTGHMIDVPGRASARFPPEAEPQVAAALRQFLQQRGARIGFASAACGADILFLEAMLALGGEINIVLPSAPESFRSASVDLIPGSDWPQRFERVLQRAFKVSHASATTISDAYFAYTNVLLLGAAKLQAKHLDGELLALSVWDGRDSGFGGTASALRLWRDCGQAVEVIDPITRRVQHLGVNAGPLAPSDSWLSSPQSQSGGDEARKLVSMLFADAVGFSKLEEAQIPRFVEHFLGAIAQLLDRAGTGPIVRNTWGDAVYFVFNDVRAAGLIALELCELVAGTNWVTFGLPAGMNVRIGLHSGPAYPITDPIIRQFSYTGVEVSRAARIEPITPPGVVYASHEFAALSEAVGVTEFVCEYVGQTPLAKHFGDFPTYRVRRLTQ